MVRIFGDFEFDDSRGRLTSGGHLVRLGGQTVDLLVLLLEKPGELRTRDEIQRRLWPDSNVEFDHSLDVLVSRLRAVLGERSPHLRYIETVPRKGYRFIEPVTARLEVRPPTDRPRPWGRRVARYAAIAILAALLAVLYARTRYDKFVPSARAPESVPPQARP
jgi:DNA-binding winged helix-turn-helix (wHTH) protein